MNGRVIEDTTNFFLIRGGDQIQVGDRRYRVLGHAHESQFGIDDPKLWVVRTVDSESRERKILKLAFFETFITSLAGVEIRCFRSPEKEASILKLVDGHPHFMQGKDYTDPKGNNIRVLDVVRGKTFLSYIDSIRMGYGLYHQTALPGILHKLAESLAAIGFLHANGLRHGDVRTDHLFVEGGTGNYVWIDFDYDFEATENPFSLDIFGLGALLAYAVGKGLHNRYMIVNDRFSYGDLADRVDEGDFAILDQSMFVNLKKLYPIIPDALNDILMHFSMRAEVYYEYVDEILRDLNRCLESWGEDQKGVSL